MMQFAMLRCTSFLTARTMALLECLSLWSSLELCKPLLTWHQVAYKWYVTGARPARIAMADMADLAA
jgi:hypothetical protein